MILIKYKPLKNPIKEKLYKKDFANNSSKAKESYKKGQNIWSCWVLNPRPRTHDQCPVSL